MASRLAALGPSAAILWAVATLATLAVSARAMDVDAEDANKGLLPEGFLVGAGTSAYQCEGAWNVSGKGESVYDHLFHSGRLPTLANGDVAADSYHRYKEDVAAAKALKLQMYRISFSWARLFPTGHSNNINPDGVRYYNDLLNEIRDNGIKPMVTLFHLDPPQSLIDEFGGWDDDGMIDAFVEFADFVFTHFGDRVQHWATFNEPFIYCGVLGIIPLENMFTRQTDPRSVPSSRIPNGNLTMAPGSVPGNRFPNGNFTPAPGREGADYQCIHRMVIAHGRVYELYKRKFAATQRGKIGLINISFAARPNSTSYDDVSAARRQNLIGLGTTFGPLVTGQYPPEVRRIVDDASRREGLNQSRLPEFTAQESHMLKGSIDFLGVNLYFGQVVAAVPRPKQGIMLTDSAALVLSNDIFVSDHEVENAFRQFTPWSLRETTLWLWNEYRVPIFVTENGLSTEAGEHSLQDHRRAEYHSVYMRELLRAVHEDGVHVLGYLAWSLIDVFEWSGQYKNTFGLVKVDYATGSLNRTLKESSSFFIRLAETRRIPVIDSPSTAAPSAPSVVSRALLGAALAALLATHG